jgi:hypothetical protein
MNKMSGGKLNLNVDGAIEALENLNAKIEEHKNKRLATEAEIWGPKFPLEIAPTWGPISYSNDFLTYVGGVITVFMCHFGCDVVFVICK